MTRSRILAFSVTAFASAVSLAQSLGTKADVTTKSSVPDQPLVQPMDMVQMFVALLIVGGLLKWVLPKAIAKLGKKLTSPLGSSIKIEESASFGAGQLQIVTVRDRTLLLCVTGQGVSCLADLTPPADKPEPAKDAFIDFLDNADPAKAVVSESVTEEEEAGMSVDEAMKLIAQAQTKLLGTATEASPLERLNRLTGTQ